jgi:Leucine-rich repeat (LRR) protein
MGGTGFSLPIARRPGGEGSSKDLYYALIELLTKNAHALAKGKAYTQVTAEYLDLVIDDGEGRDDAVDFGFRDGAGLCQASTHACAHWFELLVSALAEKRAGAATSPLDDVVAQHGFRITKRPPPLEKLLAKCVAPLVIVRGHVYGAAGGKEPYLIGDELDDVDRIEMEDLRPKEKEMVVAALRAKRCACVVCEALRDKKTKLRLPKPPKAPKKLSKAAAKLPPGVTTSLRGKHRDVTLEKDGPIPDAVLAPKTLDSLNVNGPVTTLPDALAEMPALAAVRFSRTKFTRLPPVLARMPALRTLTFYQDAFEAPAELAALPELTLLRFANMPAIAARIGELPFEALGKLETLDLRENGIEVLPDEVGALRSLRDLSVSGETITDLPRSLARLEGLQRVTLYACPLRGLPPVLGAAKALTYLSACDVGAEVIPDWIADLPALDDLTLDDNPIAEVPRSLARSSSLRELSIESPVLREVQGDRLPPNLRRLCLRAPELTKLGDLSALGGLESLYLSGCTKLTLPRSLAKSKTLKVLRLGRCDAALAALPEWLGELPLTELSLVGAPLAEVPAWLRKLPLTYLDLSQMENLKTLPDWLAELPLEYLDVSGSALQKGEAKRIKALLPKALVCT